MDSLDKLMGESISRKVELIRTKIGKYKIENSKKLHEVINFIINSN